MARSFEQIVPLEVGSVEYMRLAARLGGDRILEDARDVAFVLERAETALTFIERLPKHQDSVSSDDAKRFAALYADARKEAPDHAYLLLLILSSRLRRAADIHEDRHRDCRLRRGRCYPGQPNCRLSGIVSFMTWKWLPMARFRP